MKYCSKCDVEHRVPADHKFCPVCGSEFAVKPSEFSFSPTCGHKLGATCAFCPECGGSLAVQHNAPPVNPPKLGQLQGVVPVLLTWSKERWMFLLSGVGTILFSLFGWASVRGAEILQMIAGELGIPLSSIGTSFNLFSLHNLIGTAARIASSFDFDELSSVRSFLSVLIAILLAGFGCLIFAAVWHFKGKQWKVFAAFGFILVLILIILWILAVLLINFAAREEFGFALLRLSKPSFIVLASCVVGLISLKKAKA